MSLTCFSVSPRPFRHFYTMLLGSSLHSRLSLSSLAHTLVSFKVLALVMGVFQGSRTLSFEILAEYMSFSRSGPMKYERLSSHLSVCLENMKILLRKVEIYSNE